MQKLVGLEVGVAETGARVGAVIGFGKEAGAAQDNDGQPVAMGGQIAQRFGPGLSGPVDVFRAIPDIFGDPGSGIFRARGQRAAKGAGCRGEDEGRSTRVARGVQ